MLAPHELVDERTERRADDAARRGRSRATCRSPETTAGPSDRIGFIDAPEIGPPNIASRPIVPPIAIAAASPTARVSVATAMITNIRKAVMTSSQRNDCASEPDGSVAPTCGDVAERARAGSAAAERADELGDPVGDGPRPGEVPGEREGERDGGVEVRAGDVPDRVDHRHDHEPERDRDADVAERVRSSRRP